MKKVTFLPKRSALAIKEPSNIISLNSPSDFAKFTVKHKRLLSQSFYPNDYHDMGQHNPTEEHARAIIEFVKSCDGEDIVVHCSEGKVRSVAVAEFIAFEMGYELDLTFPGCEKQMGNASINLGRLLHAEYKKMKAEQSQSAGE